MVAAESTMPQQQNSDLGENGGGGGGGGGGGIDSPLPPRVVVGPDENGVRKIIQYRFDDESNKFEVVTTITPVGKLARAPTAKSSIKRNPSSADAMEDDAKSRFTNVSTKGILPEPSRFSARLISGNKAQERGVPMVPMECLICRSKGHHWTVKCPSRSQATVGMSPIADGPSRPREAIKRGYCLRSADRIRDDVKRIMNDDRCVRVTNLSKEAREDHLVGLFSIFGFVTHVYIPVDENGSSRGVGYVKFAHRREAESAIEMLNGRVYKNLTLQFGWAAPRRLN